MKIDMGFISIDDFHLKLNSNNSKFVVSFDQIQLQATLDLKIEKDLKTQELDINVSGKGFVGLSNLFFANGNVSLSLSGSGINEDKSGNGIDDDFNYGAQQPENNGSAGFAILRIELFEIQLDDFKGSAINLSLNLQNISKTKIESFSSSGSITRIILRNLSINANFKHESGNFSIDMKSLIINFEGSGSFSVVYANKNLTMDVNVIGNGGVDIDLESMYILLSIPGLGTISINISKLNMNIAGPASFLMTYINKTLNMNGHIYDPAGEINIDHLFIDNNIILPIEIDIDDFNIKGATLFNFTAYVDFEGWEPGEGLPTDYYLFASCDSTWTM